MILSRWSQCHGNFNQGKNFALAVSMVKSSAYIHESNVKYILVDKVFSTNNACSEEKIVYMETQETHSQQQPEMFSTNVCSEGKVDNLETISEETRETHSPQQAQKLVLSANAWSKAQEPISEEMQEVVYVEFMSEAIVTNDPVTRKRKANVKKVEYLSSRIRKNSRWRRVLNTKF